MNIRGYLNPLIKWWWLIIIAAGLAVGTSSYFLKEQPPVYRSRTTLLIGQALNNPNPSGSEFYLGQQLAGLYADIARREPLQNAAKEALELSVLPRYDVGIVANSQFLEINVYDSNPELAWKVADELARQLILLSPSNLGTDEQARRDFIKKQMDGVQSSIIESEQQIVAAREELGKLTSAREIGRAREQIDALTDKLTTLQTTYANLAATSPNSATNILSIVEPAALPLRPQGPNPMIIVAIAGLFGFALAGGAAYLLEYLDDRIYTPEDVINTVHFPILGYVAEMDQVVNGGPYVLEQPRSVIAEAFRSLRANLEFPKNGHSVKTILVTSPEPADGKSSVAVNLALIYAQSGKKVVFLDADLRNPTAHSLLGIPNHIGLSEILHGETDVYSNLRSYKEGLMGVITAGNMTSVPTESLNSNKIGEVLEHVKSVADVVILDGAPMFVADALLWATRVDGVLLVLRPGHSRKEATRILLEQIQRLGASILGVVLNRIPISNTGGYSRYRLYYPYYYSRYGEKSAKPSRRQASKTREPIPSAFEESTIDKK